jgi:UDP-glucose 4-epimerase
MKPIEEMTILVTGGAGFVGSSLVAELVRRGVRVLVLDDLFTGKVANLPASDRVEFTEGSVCDEALVGRCVARADLVFHLAARNIIISTKEPRQDYATNIGGTLNVLLAARERGTKVVYTSSTSVYGNPRYLPINEDDGLNLLSPYATSKLAGENYCLSFFETYGLPTTAVRYSNIYGPRQSPDNPYCGVIAKFFESVAAGKPPMVHGDGEQTRDFTYVDDAVEATITAGLSARSEGRVYNVATGFETSINQLAAKIASLHGANLAPIHIDRRDIDNIRRRVCNIERIRRELRWVPRVTIDRGLSLTKEWLDSQRHS